MSLAIISLSEVEIAIYTSSYEAFEEVEVRTTKIVNHRKLGMDFVGVKWSG